VKRSALLLHLRKHGCHLIGNNLARKICRGLSVPEIGQQ
jgi:hypothetical protein